MTDSGYDRRVTIDRRRADRRLGGGTDGNTLDAQRTNAAEAVPPEVLWDARDVARHLKVSVSWVRQRVSANRIPFVRIGGWMIRFRPDEIRAFSAAPLRGKVLPIKGSDHAEPF